MCVCLYMQPVLFYSAATVVVFLYILKGCVCVCVIIIREVLCGCERFQNKDTDDWLFFCGRVCFVCVYLFSYTVCFLLSVLVGVSESVSLCKACFVVCVCDLVTMTVTNYDLA